MKHRNNRLSTALALIPFAAHCQAGIQWDSSSSLSIVGNGGEFIVQQKDRLGHTEFTIGLDTSHPDSDASIKTTHDSLIENRTYKHATSYHLQTLSSDIIGFASIGATYSLNSLFTIDNTTTIQIQSELNGFFQPFRDSYGISIVNANNNTQILNISEPSDNLVITLELGPGTYRMIEDHEMIAVTTRDPFARSFHVFTTVSVVPTPATLAALTPLGILATRRRR